MNKAVSDCVPDVLDKVLSECKPQKGRIIDFNTPRKSRGRLWVKALVTAAAVAIIIGCVSLKGTPLDTPASAAGYSAILENSSGQGVLMQIGADGLVSSAELISPSPKNPVIEPGAVQSSENTKAFTQLATDSLIGKPADEAMNMAAGALHSARKPADTFLLTLIPEAGTQTLDFQALLSRLMTAASCDTGTNSGTYIAQVLSTNGELEKAAAKNGISPGKESFMAGLMKAASESGIDEFDELANFDLNTLAVLAGNLLQKLPDTRVQGTPDSSSFVGVEAAVKTLLSSIKLTEKDRVENAHGGIRPQGSAVVYDVSVEINGVTIVGGNVDAVSGELLEMFSDDGSGPKTVYVKSGNLSIDSTEVSVVYDPATGLAVNVTDEDVFDSTDVQVKLHKDGTISVVVVDTDENIRVTVPAYDKEKGFVDWLTKIIKGNVAANLGS